MTDPAPMRRAIALSAKGFPAPNPHVGCVIVRDGEIVGEGYHHFAGGPHAERVALAQAGDLARGADVYVTLEPCNHWGRTPPCSLGLLETGIKRVVYASPDPNPRAEGGAERLRREGVEVTGNFLEAEARVPNRQFLFAFENRRPFIVVKAAATLDGRIALPSGESKWITGEPARKAAHRLRAELGAVLVGYRTVLADDPQLTARIPGVRNQPVRIVLDPDGVLQGNERVFDQEAPTKHVTGRPIDLHDLARKLFDEGITGVLVEGGAGTISRFVDARLVDQFEIFIAPKLFGDGPTWVQNLLVHSLAAAPELKFSRIRRLGSDLQLTALPVWERNI